MAFIETTPLFAPWKWRQLQETVAAAPSVLGQSGTPITRTGSTAEGALVSIPVPANALGANGIIRVTAVLRRTTGTSAVGTRLRFGPEGVGGTSLFAIEPATDGTIQYTAIIANKGATNAQVASLPLSSQTGGTAPTETAFDTTAEQFITLTGRTEGNAADVLTLEFYLVELFPSD